ncbi:ABC transporter substrate-binding protein [Candidatus Halobonum tyrrellensis]|uniref:ABC transporter periplasmic protein n=1 Tax=Candidatus Halobonum tyrrellensis G22 TaxID=1324957 RepID=V4HHM5_9EURY|nr:ABC transporter substrate-binding protein [Candidatus Halobonum tyrrellensis]ESP87389.1 ABC transporter periplasmic protein [Candidatus Halobonum tyrrellensis G22]
MASDQISDEELSGPVVDRRTTTKLLAAAGLGGLAGCAGGGGGDATTAASETSEASSTDGNEESTDVATDTPSGDVRGGRLQAGWFTGSIDNLDPPYIGVGQYFQVAANVFSGLVTLNEDLTVRGDLANDWTVENDGATFVFDLREGVTFHDGSAFTAEDVRYTIDRTISQETPAAAKLSSLQPVDDGGVVVDGDYSVTLNFEEPLAPALIYLSRGPGRAATIVSQEAIEEMGAEQYAVEPVGTGPFEVAEHSVGSELVLDAYDDYFETDEEGTALPYLDGVTITPIPEPSSIVNALRSGDIQFANLVPLQNVSQVSDASEVDLLQAPGVNWNGLAMNQTREPFGSRQVRRGIAKLIDTEQFVETAYFGNALAAAGPINAATAWVYREDKPDDQAYAPEEGKQLLEDAGAAGASFSLLTTESDLRAAQAMRQQLNSAGLDVEIEQVTSSTYWDRTDKSNRDFDVTVIGSVGDPDPEQSLWNFYRKDGPWNYVDYQNDEVHQLLGEQRSQLDRDARAETLQELEGLLIADTPHAYLSHQDDLAAMRTEVGGFTHVPYMRNFHTVSLDE